MQELARLCAEKTRLCAEDVALLARLADTLQHVSNLNACDAFIDCLDCGGTAFVAAQSDPRFHVSRYKGSVVGQNALRENEPAVYHCFERGVPVHDTRAMTQENRTVQQDAAPIENGRGEVIGVMICERDISREASLASKLDASEREREALFRSAMAAGAQNAAPEDGYVREAYHRIKNDLQMLASNCNIRMRQAKAEETKLRLYETMQQLLAVASLHDVLTMREADAGYDTVSLQRLLSEVLKRIRRMLPEDRSIEIVERCDPVFARTERARCAALVVTELVTNAVSHAFPDGTGRITVSVHADASRCSAIVEDDGAGMRGGEGGAMGLALVAGMVRDTLEGDFSIVSTDSGTAASFSFRP